MTAEEMWLQSGLQGYHEAWAFGGAPDKLAELVLKGKKTATASAYIWYERGQEKLPEAGDYSIILNSCQNALCIIQTTKVYVTTFDHVSESHAYKEGEGDRSLAYWRQVHREFFSGELAEIGQKFDKKMKVVCEEFKMIWP